MRTFPGCFPPSVMDALDLDRYAEAFGLALDHLEAEAEARRAASQES